MGNSKSSAAASAAEKALVALFARPSALAREQFALAAIGHHGVPSNARAIAFCGLQGLLAVGTASGAIKLFGKDALEVLLALPIAQSQHQAALALGVVFMQFTARQRLVVTYSDSSIRVFDLADPSRPHAELRGSWTTSTITCIETIRYQNFPFVFIATDDGDIHVMHEDTGRVSTYTISPRDVGVTSTAESTHSQVVTAIASNPRDANQVLVAYDASSSVFLWDFAKRKVLREFTLAKSKVPPLVRASTSASTSSGDRGGADSSNAAAAAVNSPQTLSWHANGKRFAVGYKHGGFAVFRYDKSVGFYHCVSAGSSSDDATNSSGVATAPIRQLQWICALPTSKNVHLPGALLFSRGGGSDSAGSAASTSSLTLVYPPSDIAPDDALSDLTKCEQLAWRVAAIPSVNSAEIAGFAVASDHVDHSAKLAPFTAVVLSGNPLDGCVPSVSVQPLPCYVRLTTHDREDWDWRLERLALAAAIPPLLQRSALSTFTVVNLAHSDGSLQDDLFTTWDPAAWDRAFELLASEDVDWPLSGGSVVEPLLARFVSASGALQDEMQALGQHATLLLTGHANGCVMVWELLAPAEHASSGTLQLLHVVDVAQLMGLNTTTATTATTTTAAAETMRISCLAFCADARVLVVGFATGELAVLEFGQWTQRRPSALHESHFSTDDGGGTSTATQSTSGGDGGANDGGAEITPLTGAAGLHDVTGFHLIFSTHVHSHAITHVSLSTAYGYVAAADASGVVSLTHLATQSHKLLVFELLADNDPVSVDALLMSELVQSTELPLPPPVVASAKTMTKGSPTKLRRTSRSNSGTDSTFVAQCREVVPILFVGRGTGKLEMFHVQSGAKLAESLVDARKAASLSSILMVDADGKRIEIPGRVWTEQGDGIASVEDNATSTESPTPTAEAGVATSTESAGTAAMDDDEMSAHARHVRSPSTELEYTKQLVLTVIREQAAAGSSDVVLVQNEEQLLLAPLTRSASECWSHSNVIDIVVPAGSLGLHLFTDVETHAVVKGFVTSSTTAAMLEARGVRAGHVITAINGLDVTAYGLHVVIAVLERLRDREKAIVFAEGLDAALAAPASASSVGAASEDAGACRSAPRASSKPIGVFSDLLGDGANHTDVERPRFLLCTCGRSVHLLPAAMPRASEMALGVRELLAQPLASAQVRAPVVATAVVRVPVAQRVEHCVVVLDQSNYVYVFSLLSLTLVAELECLALGNALDAICVDVTANGELVVANTFGELARFSCFAEPTATESALLARKCVKTRLVQPERAGPIGATSLTSKTLAKKSSGIADAGKMFKKLVAGLKDDVDLLRVFQFATPEHERVQLLGDRTAKSASGGGDEGSQSAGAAADKKIGKGIGDTKDALMQAAQHLSERGEKLGDLALKTEQMKQTSEDFYQTMRAFNEKNAKKKWYDF